MPKRTVDPVIVPFNVVVVAGTAIAAAVTSNPPLPRGVLESIDLQIPPGHAGTTGIRFTYGTQQIVPWSNTVAWINGDDFRETFPVDVEIDDGLRVVAYNIGNFDHTFFLRFRVRQLDASSGIPKLTVIDTAKLNRAG